MAWPLEWNGINPPKLAPEVERLHQAIQRADARFREQMEFPLINDHFFRELAVLLTQEGVRMEPRS